MIEDRKLVKVSVLYDGGKSWTLQWTGGFHVFQGSQEDFGKFLRKLHVKDDKVEPHSFRSMKYQDISADITATGSSTIWVWAKDLKNIGAKK